MKTLLIPVDFSIPSNNAVAYAAGLSNNRGTEHIILFTHFYISVFEQIFPSADFIQTDEEERQYKKRQLTEQLEAIKLQLLEKLHPGITVEVELLELPLLRSFLEMIKKKNPDLIIIGSSNDLTDEESCMGNHLIEFAKISPVPLLIVPSKSHYEPITNALVACNFSSLNQVSLLQRLEKIAHWPHPKLSLVNIDPTQKRLQSSDPTPEIKAVLSDLLKGYEYQLCHSDDKDIVHGVVTFADQHNLQLIIALPGIHSFLYNLTHQSISSGLSINANKPVLILK